MWRLDERIRWPLFERPAFASEQVRPYVRSRLKSAGETEPAPAEVRSA